MSQDLYNVAIGLAAPAEEAPASNENQKRA